MAILDILYAESDEVVLEVTGVNTPITDILYDNPEIIEVEGVNGSANDILYDNNTIFEIPNVLITDFAFL